LITIYLFNFSVSYNVVAIEEALDRIDCDYNG
jgi:hypothetical protein